jgi:hypothetical protein
MLLCVSSQFQYYFFWKETTTKLSFKQQKINALSFLLCSSLFIFHLLKVNRSQVVSWHHSTSITSSTMNYASNQMSFVSLLFSSLTQTPQILCDAIFYNFYNARSEPTRIWKLLLFAISSSLKVNKKIFIILQEFSMYSLF